MAEREFFSFGNQSQLQPFIYAGIILSNGWTKYNKKLVACLCLYGGRDLKTKETNKQKREGSDLAENNFIQVKLLIIR